MKVTERLLVEIIQNDPKTAISFHSKRPKFRKKDVKNPITGPTLDKNVFSIIILLQLSVIYSMKIYQSSYYSVNYCIIAIETYQDTELQKIGHIS